jgi:glycosyltransferase involved in cell wall biosynthesis
MEGYLKRHVHLPRILLSWKETNPISVIITVLNEEGTIGDLMDSLLTQSLPPDEVVVIDGGSKDATTRIVRSYAKRGLPIHLIVEPGSNISRARNIGIGRAKHDILAITDAGCRPEPDWLRNIVKPMMDDPGIDVVAGAYTFYGENLFERCVVAASWTPIDTWNEETFLPASRSIAFRRAAWEKVGGYPEYLDFAEDTRFDLMLKRSGAKFKLARDAVVLWRVRPTARALLKAIYNYVKWDTISGEYRRRGYFWVYAYLLSFGLLIALTYLFGVLGLVVVFVLFVLYFLQFGILMALRMRRPAALYHGIKVAGAMRLGEFFGLIAGLVHGRAPKK